MPQVAEHDVQAPHGPTSQSTRWQKLKSKHKTGFCAKRHSKNFDITCITKKSQIDKNLPASPFWDLRWSATVTAIEPPTRSRTTKEITRFTVVNWKIAIQCQNLVFLCYISQIFYMITWPSICFISFRVILDDLYSMQTVQCAVAIWLYLSIATLLVCHLRWNGPWCLWIPHIRYHAGNTSQTVFIQMKYLQTITTTSNITSSSFGFTSMLSYTSLVS